MGGTSVLGTSVLGKAAFWLSEDDPHPTPVAHEVMAEALFEAVAPLVAPPS